jgi:hypothetical protein
MIFIAFIKCLLETISFKICFLAWKYIILLPSIAIQLSSCSLICIVVLRNLDRNFYVITLRGIV